MIWRRENGEESYRGGQNGFRGWVSQQRSGHCNRVHHSHIAQEEMNRDVGGKGDDCGKDRRGNSKEVQIK